MILIRFILALLRRPPPAEARRVLVVSPAVAQALREGRVVEFVFVKRG